MGNTKQPQITSEQLEQIGEIEGEILAEKENLLNSQKIIFADFDRLTKIFDEIKNSTI